MRKININNRFHLLTLCIILKDISITMNTNQFSAEEKGLERAYASDYGTCHAIVSNAR